MFVPHFITPSPFNEIAGFLARRYQLSEEGIKPPLLELVIGNAVTLELLEEGAKIYLIGVVVDPLLINEDREAMELLTATNNRLGSTEGTLAWDEEKKRLIFWLEVTNYTRELEFNEHLVIFLNDLDEWLALVPR
ncbi:MAG: hypothetical protein A3F67_00645 [Verrucomicrobia bacterium RIFCSPHIGHO2_12_FULL_41_10]|nr:MAG: hypothetical protein A3F67_00645 [Verrucomicrobia bacterium RIFCSPHIGHO2_12_FULL_41_10]HLB34172.1 type III secretion system chaperone [Chthoniobacterales bacterium]